MNEFNPNRYPQHIVEQIKESRELNNRVALTAEQIQTMPRKNVFDTICGYNGYGNPTAIESLYEDIYSVRLESAEMQYAIVNMATNEMDSKVFDTPEEALECLEEKLFPNDWKLAARMVIKTDWDLTGGYPGCPHIPC